VTVIIFTNVCAVDESLDMFKLSES